MPVHMVYICFKVVCSCDFFEGSFPQWFWLEAFELKLRFLFIYYILLSPEIEAFRKAFEVIALTAKLKDFLILYRFTHWWKNMNFLL